VTSPTVLVATWHDGVFVVAAETIEQEFRNQSVRALAADRGGGSLAIVNGRSLHRRAPDGVWSAAATTELDLACCVAVGDVIYVGTDDARVLRAGADGTLEQLRGFDAVEGRETWYAGSAVIKVSAWDHRSGSARSRQLRTARSSWPTFTWAVSLGRPTVVQRGSRLLTSRATSTRFGRTRPAQAS